MLVIILEILKGFFGRDKFMLRDIFSSFDEQNGNFVFSVFFVWFFGFLTFFFVFSLFWVGFNRFSVFFFSLVDYLWGQVSRRLGFKVRGFSFFVCVFFFFVVLTNFLGLFPYVFSSTSHLVVTFSVAVPF